MSIQNRPHFWREAIALQGSVTPVIAPNVLTFGLIAAIICITDWLAERHFQGTLKVEVAPFEVAGAVLGLILIARTNAGYDRWWEARKLWGGIVNQSRNLAVSALAYGPADPAWRERFVRWAATFPHIARCCLRNEPPTPEVARLVGPEASSEIARSPHMPSYVALVLANMLRQACDNAEMDRIAFLNVDKERAALIDHIGACERIVKTPMPVAYSIIIRRFIALFLLTIPFALLHRVSTDWLVPVITMFVAYPLVSLDQIGIELQNPFAVRNLSHLPLNDISDQIEKNLMGLWAINESAMGTSITPPSLDGETGTQLISVPSRG
jgi:putative membrane protein